MKNYINQTLGFTSILLVLLIGLSLVPDGTRLGAFSMRRMDIFSDVRSEKKEPSPDTPLPDFNDTLAIDPLDTLAAVLEDSTALDTQAHGAFPAKDSLVFGKIIEDYSFEQTGLSAFFKAIDAIKAAKKVRVAWYGDSFVEGDILIGDLRDTLQSLWGGHGVGFVPITSEVAQFKRTVKHQFKNWNTFSIVKKTNARPPLGLNGYAYQPKVDASITYEGARYFKNTHSWTSFQLFFTASNKCAFEWAAQDRVVKSNYLDPQGQKLSTWRWEQRYPETDYFHMKFQPNEDLILYGAALENGPGIYIDNFSIRGNSGGPLKLMQPEFIRQFDAYQQYDLVVLQVGLNAVTNALDNIRWYQAELERTYTHLRECFPDKPILIVSVGDRGGKIGTELATMRGVGAIVSMQRDLARKHGFLFYDLFHGMGGPNTMIKFAMKHPRLANTDYTHLTHDGGRVVGLMFARVLMEEQNRWRAQNNAR